MPEELGKDGHVDSVQVKDKPIEDLYLSIRSEHCLTKAGFKTVGDLDNASKADLRRIKNMTDRCVLEVEKAIQGFGLSLQE